ncbi:MAG: TRAP transporter small permease, partial [Dehalococcoidia bacterium]|nr:TRAP transporter small permease [Dehalococcoidia bacterium]
MRKHRAIALIESGVHTASRVSLRASGVFMLLMLLTVIIDVSTRLMRLPVKGAYDLGEIFMVCITYTAIGYTQHEKGHIRVDILLSKLPKRAIQVLDTLTHTACASVAFLIAYAMAGRVWSIISGTGPAPVSLLLAIPLWPFLTIVTVGSLLLGLE